MNNREEKVSLTQCADYGQDTVDSAMAALLGHLGGIEAFVQPGQKVLIKPNLLMRRAPDKATTTHPAVAMALARMVQSVGGIPILADSPGGPFAEAYLRQVYKGTGMQEVSEKTGAALGFDTATGILEAPNGKQIQRIDVMQAFLDADVLISLGKLKTHGLTTMTGAVKNLYGLVPGTVKVDYHARFSDRRAFADMLVDLYEAAKPALCIIDAVECMEGEGPSGGKPRHMGALIASANGHAADTVGAQLIGLEPEQVVTLEAAQERGSLPQVQVEGSSIEALRIEDFDIPMLVPPGTNSIERLSKMLLRFLRPKPVFPHVKCNGCGVCVKSCPANAIAMDAQNRPEVRLRKCIRCFCCQELCPQNDVQIRRHPIMRLVR